MVAEVEQQLATEPDSSGSALTAAAPAAAAGEAAVGAAAAAGSMLTVLSLEGSKLKLLHRCISQITLSAYLIDTELLFTSQPFSSLSAAGAAPHSSAGTPAAQRGALAGRGRGSGLGKVALVQPTARMVLRLPLKEGAAGAMAVPAAGAGGGTASRVPGAAGSAADCCILDINALMPQLASQSVLLEVAGGGVTRALPR